MGAIAHAARLGGPATTRYRFGVGLFRRQPEFSNEVRRIVSASVGKGTPVVELEDDLLRVGDVVLSLGNLRARWNQLPDE